MPNDRDDTRLASPSQLLFDVLTYIEELRRTLADTEAMAHGAESKLARLPYIPWPGQPQEPDFGASTTVRPRHVKIAPAIDAGAPEYEIEQRLDVGRLHTYVIASATSMRDVMAECDRLIAYTRRRIDEVHGMRMVPADDTPDPGPQGPASAPATNTPTDNNADAPEPSPPEDTEHETPPSEDTETSAASSNPASSQVPHARALRTTRSASRALDPAKVTRAARAAARRPKLARPSRVAR
ncbi:hypothetical protein [Haliangium sp.]|uniref:hypothetical protein n=1 Tax=Haliangium sp. TaxID=2663208 RepID=UPI003D0E54FB